MDDETKGYRSWYFPNEFWEDLLQVRNHLWQIPGFREYVCLHAYNDPLAEAFWRIDNRLDGWSRRHET